jgi:hypothetical protein
MDLGQYQPLEMTTEMLRGTPLHYSQGQCEEEEDHEGVQGCTNEADNTPDITHPPPPPRPSPCQELAGDASLSAALVAPHHAAASAEEEGEEGEEEDDDEVAVLDLDAFRLLARARLQHQRAALPPAPPPPAAVAASPSASPPCLPLVPSHDEGSRVPHDSECAQAVCLAGAMGDRDLNELD